MRRSSLATNSAAFCTSDLCSSNVLTLGQQKYLYSKHPQLKAQATKDAAEREQGLTGTKR